MTHNPDARTKRNGWIARTLGFAYDAWRVRFDRVGFARSVGALIGEECRILGMTRETFGSEPFLVDVGRHVTICAGVRFITHDGGVWIFRDAEPNLDVIAPIRVGNNVFLGLGAIIMPGVTIGNNVVIGAGSVVVSDIADDCVAAGVPARAIRSVAEYRERLDPYAFSIRDWSPERKRSFLIDHFKIDDRKSP